jgi:hypothetical protein
MLQRLLPLLRSYQLRAPRIPNKLDLLVLFLVGLRLWRFKRGPYSRTAISSHGGGVDMWKMLERLNVAMRMLKDNDTQVSK